MTQQLHEQHNYTIDAKIAKKQSRLSLLSDSNRTAKCNDIRSWTLAVIIN